MAGLSLTGTRIDDVDGQIPVGFGQFPAVVFFFLERLLVGKKLPCDFPLVLGRCLVLKDDEHAIVSVGLRWYEDLERRPCTALRIRVVSRAPEWPADTS